jgi:predicted PurR-regulated permease PerM
MRTNTEAPVREANMPAPEQHDHDLDQRIASRVMDVFIRLGLVALLVLLCYRALSPFLTLLLWSLILAVALYPLNEAVARRIGGRHGLAATLIAILGLALIVAPSAVLMSSLGDSVHQFIRNVQTNALEIPAPRDAVATWPFVGPKLHAIWSQAHADLPALVQSLQPQLGDIAKAVLGFVGGIGVGLLQFLAAFIIAGIIMAFGEAGDRANLAIFQRVLGPARGAEFAKLSTATIRAVAQGVIGVAFIQAIIVGLCLLVAGIPWPGLLALVVLILGIAQVPALLVTLPAIGYIWWSGSYGNGEGNRLHRAAVCRGHGGQRAEAADARARREGADGRHPARRAGGHGDRRHSRLVRGRNAADAGLQDLHELGGGPPEWDWSREPHALAGLIRTG